MYKNWMNSRSLNIYFNKEREWWNWCNLFTSCELFFKENSLVANELQHLHLIRSVENVHNLNKTKLRCFCYVFKLKFFLKLEHETIFQQQDTAYIIKVIKIVIKKFFVRESGFSITKITISNHCTTRQCIL